MAELYTCDGTHLTTIRDGSVELSQAAETGRVATGRVAIDDTAGTLTVTGQKNFSVTQSACASNLLYRGFVDERTYGRDAGQERAPHVGTARGIGVGVVDLNAMLGFRLIDGSDGKRPAETVAARGAWLMASDYVTGLFVDNGRCSFSASKGMDAADYRSQYPGDVLTDMAMAQTGVNYHVNDYGSGPELTFRDDNASTADSCALRISNVLSDASAVTLHPFADATLTRSPANVYSKIAFSYAKGTRYRERAATATTFNGERGGTASNSNVKTAAKADDEADAMLWQHHTETDIIECTVLVTDAEVNLLPPGWRVQAKFSHLTPEGYGAEFTWFRILEVTKHSINAEGELYEIRLKLSPQEEAAPAGAIVQSVFIAQASGGATATFPNPVTVGNLLVYMACSRNNLHVVDPPNTSVSFPRWGAGAWTDATPATTLVEWDTKNSPPDYREGLAIYWKIADSTEQSCGLDQYSVHGAWEISGSTMTGATIVSKSLQASGTTHNIGSLGTPAANLVALVMLALGADGTSVSLSPGSWVRDIHADCYENAWASDANTTGFNCPAPAEVWIGHQITDGAALSATLTDGTSHKWAGIALVIPAL